MKGTQVVLLALLLQSCVTATKEEVASADFGRYPSDYQDRVKKFMITQIRLRPETAIYEFSEPPRKGFCQYGLLAEKRFGWIVPVKITVRNHFGFRVSENCFVFLDPDGTAKDCTGQFRDLANYVE